MPQTGIGFVRNDVNAMLAIWYMLRDAIQGETAIKGEYGVRREFYRGVQYRRSQARNYLPQPNPTDKSPENEERYRQYVERAVYYNFSRRTRDGLVGQIFLRPPVVKKPSDLNCMDNNADGKGLQLVQVAKRLCQSTLTYGQAGLLADYPTTSGALTPNQIKEQNIQPTLTTYYPWQITNWATKMVGAQRILSLVVLQEWFIDELDDYAVQETLQYRALRLDKDGYYFVEVHKNVKGSSATTRNGKGTFAIDSTTYPTDHEGKKFKVIPFQFVGAEANDYEIDEAPMYDLCSLNIAHYRNSADYEESSFICGQPTPVVTGVTKYWVDNVLKGVITLGSRASISLPEGAEAHLLQADPNTQPFEAMKQKEEQALALGAKLVQNHKTVRTATEVMVDTTAESSTLHNVANNVSAAMEQGLRWCAAFVGATVAESTDPGAADNQTDTTNVLQYQLNTEFELTRMSANDRLALIKIWQSGAICWDEMRDVLKVDGTATMDNDEALEAVQEEQAALVQNVGVIADPLQSTTPTAPENTPPPGPNQGPQPVAKANLGAKRKATKAAKKTATQGQRQAA